MGRASKRLGRLAVLAAGLRAAANVNGDADRSGRPHRRVRPIERLALDLLAHARTHPQTRQPREVDSAAVVDQVLDSLGSVLRERGVLVCVEHLPVVRAHEAQLAALLRDVILNAVAFAAPGARPRLTIAADRGSREWRFSVVDTGNEPVAPSVSSFVFTVSDG
jgi:light-regulated signal transduction histidine kinase (bacteriophytochrome)